MVKQLKTVRKTGFNQYFMDDNRVYILHACGDMQQKLTLKLKGSRESFEVIEYTRDDNFNLLTATIYQ